MNKDYIILEGKDFNKLVEEGLEKLNKKREEVEVKVIEEKKSFFKFKKTYKVKIEIKKENKPNEKLLEDINYYEYGKGYYKIDFKEDGVYLAVFEGVINQVSIEEVVNKLQRKKIEDYDEDLVKDIVRKRDGKFVKIAPPQEEKKVDAEVFIELSKDKMEGYVTIFPPEGGENLTIQKLKELIDNKIKYGLINKEIEKLIQEKKYNVKTLVAKGKEPVDGKDGYIKYYFDTHKKIAPEILEDGSVNFRNLHLIENVKKGDLLAEKVLPTEGEPGITVIGELIPQKKGKEVIIKHNKNAVISEDGMKLSSLINGQVYLEGDKVVVREVFEVAADVDNSTGNIAFNGNVKVRGNVLTGFEINAIGDVEVLGVVEGAKIKSEGNILIKKGIQGHHKGNLEARGNIIAKYIENCTLYSQGEVNAEVIMHSDVTSESDVIVVGKKGLIVGGVCRAKTEIHAKTIGSSMETSTVLEVGVNPNVKTKCENLKEELNEINNNIEKLDKSISLLNRMAKNNSLTEDKKQLLIKFLKTRKLFGGKAEELKKDISALQSEIEESSKGKVIVENVVYPGVKVVIGNAYMFVKEELKNCIIYKEKGEIKIAPYK